MDFLNIINNYGTKVVDTLNSGAISALDLLNNAVTDNADKARKFGGRVLRKAGEAVSPIPGVSKLIGPAKDYVKSIPEAGAIPILPTAVSPQARTGAGYVKITCWSTW